MIKDFSLLAKKYCPELFIKYDEPLAPYSSFKIGGIASAFVKPNDERELIETIRAAKESNSKYFLLGFGSNLLFSDSGFCGVVISTSCLKKIKVEKYKIIAQSGASLSSVALSAARADLDGISFAYGIPGSVGGAVFMNAGAYGGQMSDVVESSRYYDTEKGEEGFFVGDEHLFDYRSSVYSKNSGRFVILDTTISLKKGDSKKITQYMNELMSRRIDKQPLEYPSAGSVFKRPDGYFAGKLIEDCGLKGFSIGGAQVSEKHAGFIINTGNATANDVLSLIEHIKETVFKETSVELECEIRIIGEK